MIRRDRRGHAVSTASADAVEATERALWRTMSFYGTPLDDLDAAIAVDPDWSLPHAMKAGFLLSLTEPSVAADAHTALARAAHLAAADPNPRERSHVHALQLLGRGDWRGAGEAWRSHLDSWPRDALALQWAHLFDFYRGDTRQLRDRVASVLPQWRDPADPLRPFVLGLHAFGLEENGAYVEAEAEGRAALAADPRVPWAIHAVAHVMEMQGRPDEGRAWLAGRRPQWGDDASGNGFAGHLGWHEALFAVETLDFASALAVFDRYLAADRTEITLQRVDAASLLWRLQLLGAPLGDRWRQLLDGWPIDATAAGRSVFNDVHLLLAQLGAGEHGGGRHWAEHAASAAQRLGGWNAAVAREVGEPLMHGLVAFAAGEFDAAFDRIAGVRAHAAPLGGSHAQRDVIDQTLLAAAARGTRRSEGRAVLMQREPAKRSTPLGERWRRALSP